MPDTSCTIVCLVRDEAPYLLEWIAWHRLLGADRLVIYDNASTDGGSAMLARLHAANQVVLLPWPDRPGCAPQLDAYADAVAHCDSEWIGFLDADEFLVLPRDGSLSAFLAGFPASCGAVVVNQRVIGSNGQTRFAPGLMTERFPLGSDEEFWPNGWVKTLARTRRIARPGVHSPSLSTGDLLGADGARVVLEEAQRSFPVCHRIAYYNHYIIKSAEEYQRKRRRGEAHIPPDAPGRATKYTDSFFRDHDIAESPDPTVAQRLPALRAEHARLHALL